MAQHSDKFADVLSALTKAQDILLHVRMATPQTQKTKAAFTTMRNVEWEIALIKTHVITLARVYEELEP